MPEVIRQRRTWVNAVLFVLTFITVWYVGLGLSLSYLHPEIMGGPSTGIAGPAALWEPSVLILSLLYAAVLMAILTAHELGHYLTCRRRGLVATLPYFLPAPNLLGTFGAFIKIKSPIGWKRQLFDVGAAGPLAGFALAVPALAFGLAFSKVVPIRPGEGVLTLGEPLLLKLVGLFFFRHLPPGADLVLHPVGFAGWAGLLVTSLNLFPVGQLDGGHIAYALVGRRRGLVSMVALAAFIVLGVFFFVGWLIWGGLGLLFALVVRLERPAKLYRIAARLKHPPVFDEGAHLGRGRTALAVVTMIVFILSFIPDPIKGSSLLALLKQAGTIVK